MAKKDFTPDLNQSSVSLEEAINKLAMHQPFHWLNEEARQHPLAEFVEQVRDVTNGIALALGVIEESDFQRREALKNGSGEEIAPLLHLRDAYTLRRFAITASRMLAQRSEHVCDWLNEEAA